MQKPSPPFRNDEGFVLVAGLLILLILTLLGLSATSNTTIELQIAGNDRLHKQTLYQAEGGAITGAEILEQNFNCSTGFSNNSGNAGAVNWVNMIPATPSFDIRAFERRTDRNTDNPGEANSISFWQNVNLNPIENPDGFYNYIGIPAQADVAYPITSLDPGGNVIAHLDPDGDGDPSDHLDDTGFLYIAGETQMLPGGALQMAAGYEGKGKGAAGGGVAKIMDIYSEFRGALNSRSIIQLGWRHLVGSEGDCIY